MWSESAYCISIVLAFIKILYIFQDTKVPHIKFLNRIPGRTGRMFITYFSQSDKNGSNKL